MVMANCINTADPLMVKILLDRHEELLPVLFIKVGDPYQKSELTYNLLCAL